MKEKIRYISLFSGIGGFERGIEQTTKKEQFKCIGFSEIDKYAENIYKKHYPNHVALGDATTIRTEDLPRFDLLVGGFPCQAFSHAGKRRGFDDTRGTLFFEISRILRDKRPKYFLLENVRGLLSHERGQTFQTMLGTLSELGYDVQWQIYNSKDFNVPQNRERLYIKGYLRARCGGEVLSQRQDGTKINTSTRKQGKIGGYAFAGVDEHRKIPCTKDGNFFALTTRQRNRPLERHQDNYVFENKTRLLPLNNKAQAQKVYSSDGLATTLCANGGGQRGKTGLYKVDKPTEEPHIEVVGNVSNTNHWGGDVLSQRQDGTTINTTTRKQKIKQHTWGKDSKCLADKEYISPTVCASGLQSGANICIQEERKPQQIGNVSKGISGRVYGTDGVSSTLRANGGGLGAKTGLYTVDKHSNVGTVTRDLYVRRLTPLECERLQGFPDNWTQYGANGDRISDTQRYKCIGNAVTTNVVQYIIEEWEMKV